MLTYDAQALQVQGVNAGKEYDSFDAYQIDAAKGELYLPLARKQLQPNPQASVHLADVTFRALKDQSVAVQIQNVKAVSSESWTNQQGYKDLKGLTSGGGEAITIKIAKQDNKAPDYGSGQTGSSDKPVTPSTNTIDATKDILNEKDPAKAAEKLQALLNGLKSAPSAVEKEALLQAAETTVARLSEVPVSKEGTGVDTIFVISATDLSQCDSLLQSVVASLHKWNIDSPQIVNAQLIAVMEYTLSGRDANKLGVYHYNETSGTWDYVRGAVHQTSAGKFTIAAKQAGTYRIMEYSKLYMDTAGIYAEAKYAVEILTARHILNGTSDTLFSPSKQVTRAEFSSMIVRALNLDLLDSANQAKTAYSDVGAEAWYSNDVAILNKLGIINGFNDGTFRPNDSVTREQMVVIVMNALRSLELIPNNSGVSTEKFSDDETISSWARDSVNMAREMQLASGTGQNRFMPKQPTNRADTAVFIWKMLQQLN
ncbi:S-layer homology domain-containing protein [Paenibacillus sp. D2_2]|uniref:S-layer homology domain-containing protein n=1 Tax=Paenibacillus sp. D2_2 TaxID=3073092 RepID=UPI002816956E|nr:S-layer homology domain-containing protein [Paenibacillus sp. D2_2]WMT39890.1 S-layer homology domain-containing protein [Paenibacillus sp. D2_2]